MPTFSYKALDKNGIEVKGTLEADNEKAVLSRLKDMGYTPVDIREKGLYIDKRQALGLVGSLMLFFGVFTPIIKLPVLAIARGAPSGSISYFQYSRAESTAVLILAVISFFLVLQKKYRGLWLTGTSSLAVLFFTFIKLLRVLAKYQAQLQRETANVYAILGEMGLLSVHLRWGWVFLMIGAVLVIATAFLKSRP